MPNPHLARALARALSPRPDRPGEERRVVLLGVGSELRGDDVVGVRIARRVESLHLPGVTVLDGGTAPENLTGGIRKISPSHLIIIDSADMGDVPGSVRLLSPEQIVGMSFGTHALSLTVLAGYLHDETGCRVAIIGIQPRSLEFDAGLSEEAARSVDETVETLAACLGTASDRGPPALEAGS
ncbi:MAG TPA: hydrogenase maturation peptidase HycI [Spirochaetia bacterium]|nr:hydrogenase maturation peptidase HycI [Spirochaetia bacterium]